VWKVTLEKNEFSLYAEAYSKGKKRKIKGSGLAFCSRGGLEEIRRSIEPEKTLSFSIKRATAHEKGLL